MSQRSQDMLCRALELAEEAVAFYAKSIAGCSQPLYQDVFKKLKADKEEQVGRITEIYNALGEGESWDNVCSLPPEDQLDAKTLFKKLAAKHKPGKTPPTEIMAIDTAVDVEIKLLAFYEEKAKEAEDPTEREFVERMVQETRAHYIILNDMKYYYEDPEGWFMDKERITLDG